MKVLAALFLVVLAAGVALVGYKTVYQPQFCTKVEEPVYAPGIHSGFDAPSKPLRTETHYRC